MMLRSVLRLEPEASPCELSVVLRKPCDRIFANRKKIYPDEEIVKEQFPNTVRLPTIYLDAPRQVPTETSNETLTALWLPIPPCSHIGPCTRKVCSCVDNGLHCDRNCRCVIQCANRRKGCKCKHRKKRSKNGVKIMLCMSEDTCSCRASCRECDPELCLGCECRNQGKRKRPKCGNSSVQAARFPRIRVSPSKWGYGAFAAEPIAEGTIIGDYVGEFESGGVDDDAVEVQDMIKKHLELNYSFGIEGTDRVIDAKTAGNEMRYLNHGTGFPLNCDAKQIMVHNTNHIVIETARKVKAGEELLLNYGEKYWTN